MNIIQRLNAKKSRKELVKKAFCIIMYSHGIALEVQKRLSIKYPNWNLSEDKGNTIDNACIIAACRTSSSAVDQYRDVELFKEIQFVILTCLDVYDEKLVGEYFEYHMYLEKQTKTFVESEIRFMIGTWILNKSNVIPSLEDNDGIQELGKIFGTDIFKYWAIPLIQLNPFRINNYDLKKLLTIIERKKYV